MRYQDVLILAKGLSKEEQLQLITTLSQPDSSQTKVLDSRCVALKNRQVPCPHCGGKDYKCYGKQSGSQRFKCKDCGRTFNEYTGTWLEGLHKKSLISPYLSLMADHTSLDKISRELKINKKTAFDWRHKILATFEQDKGSELEGIVESDETFFEHSEKGKRDLSRLARKRGGDGRKRGIGDNKATVIVTADRNKSLKMTLSTMGKISKADIVESLEKPLTKESILCSDGLVSYKGFAKDNNLKHVVLRADLKQYVKKGIYHIQHINELHNRLKKWLDNTFWGVSTKYLQNYLNWFYIREKMKHESISIEKLASVSLLSTDAIKRYRYNNFAYQTLLATVN